MNIIYIIVYTNKFEKIERIDTMNKNKEELLNKLKQLEEDFNT